MTGQLGDVLRQRLDHEHAQNRLALLVTCTGTPPFRDDDGRHGDWNMVKDRRLDDFAHVEATLLEVDQCAGIEGQPRHFESSSFCSSAVACSCLENVERK